MKYIMLVPDGMADLPLAELDGQTPMQAAKTPNFDALAEKSLVGSVLTVPDGMYPGSDVANMDLLGYDPRRYYTGRGPIEARGNGRADGHRRCRLPLLAGLFRRDKLLLDNSAGHISTEEARPLIALIDQEARHRANGKFFPGVQYQAHHGGERRVRLTCMTIPPHDFVGQAAGGPLAGRARARSGSNSSCTTRWSF